MTDNSTPLYIDPTLLVTKAKEMYPLLAGKIAQPSDNALKLDCDNSDALGKLIRYCRQEFPEAGLRYWSAHCWGMIIWQPVVLIILSAHLFQCRLTISHLSQQVIRSQVHGYTLPDFPLDVITDSDKLIRESGGELRAFADGLLEQLRAVMPMNPLLAKRLLADRVLDTLLYQQDILPASHNQGLTLIAQQWLNALELPDASNLMSISICNGKQRLALDRKACCQHYRRADGDLCSTCPRLRKEERIARLQQEWGYRAGAE